METCTHHGGYKGKTAHSEHRTTTRKQTQALVEPEHRKKTAQIRRQQDDIPLAPLRVSGQVEGVAPRGTVPWSHTPFPAFTYLGAAEGPG